jgi:hypothetical protein
VALPRRTGTPPGERTGAIPTSSAIRVESPPPVSDVTSAADTEKLFRAIATEVVKTYIGLDESMEMTYLRRMHGIHNTKRTEGVITNVGPEDLDTVRKDFDHDREEAEDFLRRAESPLLIIAKGAKKEITMAQIAAALNIYARDPGRAVLSRYLAGATDEVIGNSSRPAKSPETIKAARERILDDMVKVLRSELVP